MGYRYFETAEKPVQFPFGYGLSYTTFAYSDLTADANGVTLTVTNTGSVAGSEIVQLYIGKPDSKIIRPAKELKGFVKVHLAPGEKKSVTILFDDKAFRYWNTETSRWETESGRYEIMVGASVADIRLRAAVVIAGTQVQLPEQNPALDCYRKADVLHVSDETFATLLGHPIPSKKPKIDRNLTFGEMYRGRSPLGWLICAVLTLLLKQSIARGKPELNILFIYNMPLRALAKMTNGMVSMGMVDGLVMELQGFWIIGLVRVIFEFVKNLILNAQMEKRLRGA